MYLKEETENRLSFHYGVLSSEDGKIFDLITPEGSRLRLNPGSNKHHLEHLEQQSVRILARTNPYLGLKKISYDVMFVERLNEPPELNAIEDSMPSLSWEYNWIDDSHASMHAS